MLKQEEVERIAVQLYREAGFDGEEPIPPPRLARAILGSNAVRLIEQRAIRGPAVLARVGSEWRIYVREDLDAQQRLFCVAHELGELAMHREGLLDDKGVDPEDASDRIAAALIAPRPAARAAYKKKPAGWQGHPEAWAQLALAFNSSESCAALRYSEATGTPLILLTPKVIRRRGDWMPWPAEHELRSEASHPGIVKARLRDDPQRLVVLCERIGG